MRISAALICLALLGCGETLEAAPEPAKISDMGIRPNIVAGDVPIGDLPRLEAWIKEAVTLFQSPAFEANFTQASALYPRVYVSKTQDIIPSAQLMARLKTIDPRRTALWWPETSVVLVGKPAPRSPNRRGFGFEGNRKAAAGPKTDDSGEITLGRLHFARYQHGNIVEKSCAMNTMVHEISHTLSERPDRFWMHILDSEEHVTPPRGVFEASYFIGVVAQCTYLQNKGRVNEADFQSCLLTFSDPASASRFRSRACDDFPDGTPITPQTRLQD